jgi:hypothetical protein
MYKNGMKVGDVMLLTDPLGISIAAVYKPNTFHVRWSL